MQRTAKLSVVMGRQHSLVGTSWLESCKGDKANKKIRRG
jgi:hypothetical protein